MAGNIPAVGFHDLLCVLMSGHKLLAKLSSQDFALIHYLIQKLKEINPFFVSWIEEAGIMNVMVNLPWISTKMVITTLLLILGLLLLWNISRSRTRPQTRPAGIAGLASLICNSNILDHNRHIGLLWSRPDV